MTVPLLRLVLVIAAVLFAVWALGRAIDNEYANAGKPRGGIGQAVLYVKVGDGTLIRSIERNRARTWRCQRALGRGLSPISYSAERSPSIAYRRWVNRLWARRAGFVCNVARQTSDPVRAIYAVWGLRAPEAIRVFRCESHLYVGARNGQYLGIAQMGLYARGRYGHGHTALEQARAAYRMWRAEGWHPWSCARIVGIL
jgi:hypothetical protein